MQKFFYLAASLLFLCAGFTACSDDDDAPNPPHPTVDPVAKQAFVTIQGNQYGGVAGSMDCLNLSSGETLTDLFFATNQQSLGDTPQQAVRYGSHLYVPVFGSNLVWVLNGTTLQIVKQLTITQPEAACGAEGYVFVAGNDGNLTRIDTLDYSLSAPLAVGPNPAALCTHGGKVWVSVSDGYNYENGYANGKKLAVVDAKQLKLERTVEVGLNPGALCANSRGEVFVVCRGNYYDGHGRLREQCVRRFAPRLRHAGRQRGCHQPRGGGHAGHAQCHRRRAPFGRPLHLVGQRPDGLRQAGLRVAPHVRGRTEAALRSGHPPLRRGILNPAKHNCRSGLFHPLRQFFCAFPRRGAPKPPTGNPKPPIDISKPPIENPIPPIEKPKPGTGKTARRSTVRDARRGAPRRAPNP